MPSVKFVEWRKSTVKKLRKLLSMPNVAYCLLVLFVVFINKALFDIMKNVQCTDEYALT